MKFKITFLTLLYIIMLSSMVIVNAFFDVPTSHWAYPVISKMTNKKILSGYPDGSFAPDKSITRAEFSKIFVLSFNLNLDSGFTYIDVPSDMWANKYIRIAGRYMNYYISNGQLSFNPNEEALREDVTMAIVSSLGLGNSNYNLSSLNRFTDKNNISKDREKYIAIAVEKSIVKGNADGSFNPKGKLTRAEVCQLVENALSFANKISPSPTSQITTKIPKHSTILTKQPSTTHPKPTTTLNDPNHTHSWSYWIPISGNEHKRYCFTDLTHYEIETHEFKNGFCIKCKYDPSFENNETPTSTIITTTNFPTIVPTSLPLTTPTTTNTNKPTPIPTIKPTATITKKPTSTPTVKPTATITKKPTSTPIVTSVPIKIPIPSFKPLSYNEKEQGIEPGEGYTFTGTFRAIDIGEYIATAKLSSGYVWNNGTTSEIVIKWKIDKGNAKISIKESISSFEEGNTYTLEYTYTGDGTIKAKSSDTTLATTTVDSSKKIFSIKTISSGTVTITLTATEGEKYKSASKSINIIINSTERPIYAHTFSGKLVNSYSDSSIDVKIEDAEGFYISKIWVKDPSKQLQKADQSSLDWNKTLRRVSELMSGKKDAIIAVNGSGFNHDPYWTGSQKYGGDWDNTPTGHIVITNGVIRRKRDGYDKETVLSILNDGSIKFFKNATYDTIINAGTKHTLHFSSSLLIENGVQKTSTNTSTAPRTAFGQIDKNNFIFLTAKGKRNSGTEVNYKTLNQLSDMGMKLGCQLLFNCDGGGSTTLWFNRSTLFYGQATSNTLYPANTENAYIYGPRPVADAIYFASMEK